MYNRGGSVTTKASPSRFVNALAPTQAGKVADFFLQNIIIEGHQI